MRTFPILVAGLLLSACTPSNHQEAQEQTNTEGEERRTLNWLYSTRFNRTVKVDWAVIHAGRFFFNCTVRSSCLDAPTVYRDTNIEVENLEILYDESSDVVQIDMEHWISGRGINPIKITLRVPDRKLAEDWEEKRQEALRGQLQPCPKITELV